MITIIVSINDNDILWVKVLKKSTDQ